MLPGAFDRPCGSPEEWHRGSDDDEAEGGVLRRQMAEGRERHCFAVELAAIGRLAR
jgi:hypothetical protein